MFLDSKLFTHLFLIIFGCIHLFPDHLFKPRGVGVPVDLGMSIALSKHVIGLHASQIIHGAILRQFIFTEIVISSGVNHTSIIGGKGIVTDPAVVWVALLIANHQWVQVAVHVDAVYVRLVV